jgi:hypothetical protein
MLFTLFEASPMAAIPRMKCCYTFLCPLVLAVIFSMGTANGQQLTLSPASIDFGNVGVGKSSSQVVTLTNSGNGGTCGTCGASITVSAASATGTAFTLNGISLPLTLRAGQNIKFTVTFAPVKVVQASGSIAITSDALTPNLSIPLSGAAIPGNLWPKHASIAFANVQVGTGSSQIERLTNNGGASVSISKASTSSAEFSLSGLSLPQMVPAGGDLSFTVSYKPTTVGSSSGFIQIDSDGSDPKLNIPVSGAGDQITSLPECSVAKTNKKCKLIIDRANPVAPPTVQMYSKEAVTLIAKNPKPYERYFLDYQSGQATISPDVASSIVQGLLAPLAKLAFATHAAAPPLNPPTDSCAASEITRMPPVGFVKDAVLAFQECFEQISARAIDIYRGLEPDLAPDSHTPNGIARDVDLKRTRAAISDLLKSEFLMSSRISAIASDATLKASAPDGPAIQQLSGLQKVADAIANDLTGYSLRIDDLYDFNSGAYDFNNGAQDCENIIAVTKKESDDKIQCVFITSNPDNDRVYRNMVTRTVTYALDALNLISNSQEAAPDPTKKKLLASIAINFADYPSKPSTLRWEASLGTFFSSLPVRSFSVAPVFTGGAITNNVIAQNILHPTVVPFAAANYRISNDLGWTRWKSAIYWTGAVGVNPNTVSADFASGPSISWRSLMLSALWHYGHDIRLTQGLYVAEPLGAGFKGSLSTQTYWKSSFALGVSIRVPSLTGR